MSRSGSGWRAGLAIGAAAALVAVGRPGPLQGQTSDASRDAEAAEQCVLLRNGNVLFGTVQPLDDGYAVTRRGASVHVPRYQVLAVCEDLAAAYTHQRREIPPGEAVGHLQLAEWCLQHGLLAEARHEADQAANLAPHHPRLSVLERRIAVAWPERSTSASPAMEAPSGIDAQHPSVRGAAASRVRPNKLADIPDDTMEQFRRRIQPLLLNTCTTSGCHRSEDHHQLVLDRRALWRDAPHTLTVQNLSATLKYVDFQAPQESRLLLAATSAHARELESPPLAPQSVSVDLLEDWLLHISGRSATNGRIAEEDTASLGQAPDLPDAADLHDLAISDEELDALVEEEEEDRSIIERRIQRGIRPIAAGQADPFDPKEFNDRFAPRRRPSRPRGTATGGQ